MIKKFYINEGKISLQSKSKNLKTGKWIDARIPGTVYHNLLLQKLIDDPFYADNELRLQWIAESDWSCRAEFSYPGEFNPAEPVTLVFEGIDTIAEIILNDKTLGQTGNMFRRWEYDVTELLKKENILRINFTSPYKYARQQEKEFGRLPVALNSERVYIRKAQYSFGWDWGPSFADIGIWRPVYLVQRPAHYIKNFTFNTVELNDEEAAAEFRIFFNSPLNPDHKIRINLSDEKSSFEYTFFSSGENELKGIITIPNPELWWPNNEGPQHLYSMKIILEEGGSVEDEAEKKVGIRKIILHLKDGKENTFHFTVNGRRIFARGTNWIPADSFLTRVTDEKYFRLLSLAKDGNMNFIRVWGGGIYEDNAFYEYCDRLGLLVWQDFMFACASYPEHDSFLENAAVEVRENVLRLQYHPSLAIWCGNNENEWIWYHEQKKSYKEMPGYRIYSSLIPDIIKEIDHGRPYWESSPFSFEEDPNSVLSGNRHQWDLWSNWRDYNNVVKDSSLFVTEFGFQGPANKSTFEKVIPPAQRNTQSYLFEFHNKQVEGNERLFRFLAGHLPVKTEWRDFIYLGQLNQGLALETCVEHWRLNFPHTNGSVIWQLNDCWPVSSWALIDSDIKPKLSYYLVKNSFAPRIIKFVPGSNNIHLYLLDDTARFEGHTEVAVVNILNNKIKSERIKIKSSRYRTEIFTINKNSALSNGETVLAATLFNKNGQLISRAVFPGREWKHLNLPETKVKSKLVNKGGEDFISLKVNNTAFFVSLFSDVLSFKNNCVTIMPDEEILIPVHLTRKTKKITWEIFNLNEYL